MGLPEESILASEIVFNRSTSNYDKSATYSMRADAYSLMGEVDTALQFYNKALELAYYQINLYLPLTECYKEVEKFSKDDWRAMLNRMENDVKKFRNNAYITETVKQDLKKSYLLPPGTVVGQTVSNDVYWAMYNAAEKGNFSSVCALFICTSLIITIVYYLYIQNFTSSYMFSYHSIFFCFIISSDAR